MDQPRSYNGQIASILTKLENHEKRICKIEEQTEEDHDTLITLITEVKKFGEMMETHLENHKEREFKALDLKYGLILVFVQIVFNAIVIYVVTKM